MIMKWPFVLVFPTPQPVSIGAYLRAATLELNSVPKIPKRCRVRASHSYRCSSGTGQCSCTGLWALPGRVWGSWTRQQEQMREELEVDADGMGLKGWAL